MQDQDNNIINALKRLERAGSEHSKSTQKLCDAAVVVADMVADLVPISREAYPSLVMLPRGYSVGLAGCDRRAEQFLYSPLDTDGIRTAFNSYRADDNGMVRCYGISRKSALAFARDVADGWLDELGDWLQEQASQAARATKVIAEGDTPGERRQ